MRPIRFAPCFSYFIASAILAATLSGANTLRADETSIIGHPAPDFTLANATTGANTSLGSLREGRQATVLLFIAVHCPVSNAYNQRYSDIANEYSVKAVEFVGINSNQTESIDAVASHARQNNFTFPVLKDAGSATADAYGATHTPEAFVIDSHGYIVYHGRIDNNMDTNKVTTHELANALDEILAGKPVTKPETKAFGCSIKRHS
jgi:peroxiredoxin